MPVLSLRSRDFLASGGPEMGASSEGQKFANELARKMGPLTQVEVSAKKQPE